MHAGNISCAPSCSIRVAAAATQVCNDKTAVNRLAAEMPALKIIAAYTHLPHITSAPANEM